MSRQLRKPENPRRPPMQEVLALVSNSFGPKNRHARNAAIFIIHRNTDYRLREIGGFFKLSTSAITEAYRRFKRQVTSNETLSRLVQAVESQLFRRR